MHITKGKADWIDFLNPTEDDLAWLKSHFNVHDLILDELRKPSARSKVEAYDHYLYFTCYVPIYDQIEESSSRAEIDFLITKHQVITVHYKKIQPLTEAETEKSGNSLELAHSLLSSLLIFEERQLHHIQEKLEEIGSNLFKNKEKQILEKISRLKRDVSEYRIIVRHQEPVLDSLHVRGMEFWGPEAKAYLDDLLGANQKVMGQIESFREAINDFEDTNNQLMNLKINSVMKTFTILSFLTFPFVLLATIFGLHVADNPFVSMPYAFWVLLGIMVVGLVALAIYFKRKSWL